MKMRMKTYEKYGISSKRYKELCGFCEQYPEWKDQLKYMQPNIAAKVNDGMPFSKTNANSDTVGDMATKRTSIEEKISMVEECAKEASDDLWEYMIKSVCYNEPFWYLCDVCRMPISSSSFYDKRRYFFYLLSQKRQ